VRASEADDVDYASPLELLISPDGARLYVLCQQSEEVRVLDASTYAVIKNIAVGHVPRGISLSPSGDRLFVTNTWDDTLSVIDTRTLSVTATWPVGMEPSSVVEDRAGKQLFVANRISNGREAPSGWPRLKLPHSLTRRPPNLRYPRLSQSVAASHRARIGDHGYRYRARRGCGSHALTRSRRSISSRLLYGWPHRRRR
jgi:YVTN family beta-propeller protein